MGDTTKCPQCGKEISNVEYIRYGGVCCGCWHKNDNQKQITMTTFDRYHNILRVNDNIVVPLRDDENTDIHSLGIWKITKINKDGTTKCVLIDDDCCEETLFPNEIIKV